MKDGGESTCQFHFFEALVVCLLLCIIVKAKERAKVKFALESPSWYLRQ